VVYLISVYVVCMYSMLSAVVWETASNEVTCTSLQPKTFRALQKIESNLKSGSIILGVEFGLGLSTTGGCCWDQLTDHTLQELAVLPLHPVILPCAMYIDKYKHMSQGL
jgi:hypothetical protein